MELSAGRRRRALVREGLLGRNKNSDFDAWRDFYPTHWRWRLHVANRHMHVPGREHLHGAIVIIGDAAAMKPGVERRTEFRRGHKQPDKQRHRPRHAVQISARPATQLKWQKHRALKSNNHANYQPNCKSFAM